MQTLPGVATMTAMGSMSCRLAAASSGSLADLVTLVASTTVNSRRRILASRSKCRAATASRSRPGRPRRPDDLAQRVQGQDLRGGPGARDRGLPGAGRADEDHEAVSGISG